MGRQTEVAIFDVEPILERVEQSLSWNLEGSWWKGLEKAFQLSYSAGMAGPYDAHLKLLLCGCVGLALLGVILAALGADFGFLLVILAMAISTPALFHFAMQWPLKDAEKKEKGKK